MNKYNFYKAAFMILINQSMPTKCLSIREFCCGPSKAHVVADIKRHLPLQEQSAFQDAIVRHVNPFNLDRATSMVLCGIVVENAKIRHELSARYEAEKEKLLEEAHALEEEKKEKYKRRNALIDRIAELKAEEKQKAASSGVSAIQEAVEAPTAETALGEIQDKIKELNAELDLFRGPWTIEKEYIAAKKLIEQKLKELKKMHCRELKNCDDLVKLVRDFEKLFGIDMKSFAESRGKNTELAQFDPDRYADYDQALAEAIEKATELDDAA